MRVGTTRSLVYVAPVKRGVRGAADRRRRPNLAPLLMDRAMEPALAQNEAEVERAFTRLFDEISDDFNQGGAG
jgi:hypothetical protein